MVVGGAAVAIPVVVKAASAIASNVCRLRNIEPIPLEWRRRRCERLVTRSIAPPEPLLHGNRDQAAERNGSHAGWRSRSEAATSAVRDGTNGGRRSDQPWR